MPDNSILLAIEALIDDNLKNVNTNTNNESDDNSLEKSSNKISELAKKIADNFEQITGSVMKLEDVSNEVIKFCLKLNNSSIKIDESIQSILSNLDDLISKFDNFNRSINLDITKTVDSNANNVISGKNVNQIKEFNKELSTIPKWIKQSFITISNSIINIFNTFKSTIKNLIKNILINPFKSIGSFITKTISGIKNAITTPFKLLTNFLNSPLKFASNMIDKGKGIEDKFSSELKSGPSKRSIEEDYRIAGISSKQLSWTVVQKKSAVGVAVSWLADRFEKADVLKKQKINNEQLEMTDLIGANIITSSLQKMLPGILAFTTAYLIPALIPILAGLAIWNYFINPNAHASGGPLGGTDKGLSADIHDIINKNKNIKGGFATGGIVQTPSIISTSEGNKRIGESGPEAILPLTKRSDGSLGIKFDEDFAKKEGFLENVKNFFDELTISIRNMFSNINPIPWVKTNISDFTTKFINRFNDKKEIDFSNKKTIFDNKGSVPKSFLDFATNLITLGEGASYSSVNKDDANKGVSLGLLQWNASKAQQLLKELYNTDPEKFSNIMGNDLTKKIYENFRWEERRGNENRVIFTNADISNFKKLMSDPNMQKVQFDLAKEHVSNYLKLAEKRNVTDPKAKLYYADLINQYGATGAKQFLDQGTDLESIFNSSKYKYNNRRQNIYEKVQQIDVNSLMNTEDKSLQIQTENKTGSLNKVLENQFAQMNKNLEKLGQNNQEKNKENKSTQNNIITNNSTASSNLNPYQINSLIVEMMFGLTLNNIGSKYSAV